MTFLSTDRPLGEVKETHRLSLRRNFSWTLASNIVFQGCQWAMLAVLAKLSRPEIVGDFSLGLAVTAPVILFAGMNLRVMQATDAKGEFRFAHYLGLRLFMLLLACLVILGITGVSGYSVRLCIVILMVGLAKFFDSLSDVIYGLLQQQERMDRISVSRIIQGTLQLAVLAIVFRLTHSLVWATAAFALASGLITLLYDLPSASWILGAPTPNIWRARGQITHYLALLKPSWDKAQLKTMFKLALPLGIVAVLGELNRSVPRYFIQHYAGERELGIFSAMFYLAFATGTVFSALIQSATPRLAQYYVSNLRAFKRLVRQLSLCGAANGIAGILVAVFLYRPLLTLFYKPEYANRPAVFVWLMGMAAATHVASALGGGIAATRKFHWQTPVIVVQQIVIVACCAWFVPRHGILGASWALCAGYLAWMLFNGLTLALMLREREREIGSVALLTPGAQQETS